ncbi:MAG: hypothetical protein WC647_14000 [Desulfomonilaceae bacterium]|jgi:hypothetical protein
MLDWPIKRQSHQTPLIQVPPELLLRDIDAAAITHGKKLQNLVKAVIKACRLESDPKDTMSKLSLLFDSSGFMEENGSFFNSTDLTLAIAFTKVLRTIPTARTWNYLWSLAWHASALEYALSRVVTATAKEDQSFKSLFLEIAAAVIKQAAAQPGRSLTQSKREEYSQLRKDWKQKPNLTTIWWGLREGDFLLFGDDYGVFGIAADLDLKAFLCLLSEFDNPYPILAALQAAQAGWSFSRWQTLFRLAPAAFDGNRNWNGSPIGPLLLVIARDQVLQSQFGIGAHSSDEAIKGSTTEIEILAKEIAKTVAERPDAGPCAQRWATWLMRQTISAVANDPLPYPEDARSHGYVDAVFIDALGAELPSSAWNPSPGQDAETWEPWCYRCALVSIAANGAIAMPSATDFLKEWELSPEDWPSTRGESLRERASLFETFGRRPDAYGIRLLAIPLVDDPEPQWVWRNMWDTTQAIREILEFGDPDATQDKRFRAETAASQLMELLFGLGLMMLECVVDPNCRVKCDRQKMLEELLGLLFYAVQEMATIDISNRRYWSEALRHLAIRRAVWVGDAQPFAAVFGEQSKPSLGDFFMELSVETEGLFALLEVALRNRVDRQTLQQTLIESGIDLAAQIAFADRLRDTDSKRAGISSDQLSAVRSLLDRKSETI